MATLSLNYAIEANINNTPYKEGAIYVSTDTKKIFVDLNEKRLCLSNGGVQEIIYSAEEPANHIPLWIQTLETQGE